MLKIFNKPEEIAEMAGQKVNLGGRRIEADESPTGEPIEPGTIFEAPEHWYRTRRHWDFLIVRKKVGEPREGLNPLVINEPRQELRVPKDADIAAQDDTVTLDELELLDYRELQVRCKDLGLSAGGSTELLIARLAEAAGLIDDALPGEEE